MVVSYLRPWLVAVVASISLVACAQGVGGASDDDDDTPIDPRIDAAAGAIDARVSPPIDAPGTSPDAAVPIDAPVSMPDAATPTACAVDTDCPAAQCCFLFTCTNGIRLPTDPPPTTACIPLPM